jgi:hypothetical protein
MGATIMEKCNFESRSETKMTAENDTPNDVLEPVEKRILERMERQPDTPFCFLDFRDIYKHGTIRNAFSKLKKRRAIRLFCRSGPAFYVLSSSNLEKVTRFRMVGRDSVRIDFGAFLDSLDFEDVRRVHDVKFCFSVDGLYGLFSENGMCSVSRDIELGSFVWSRSRVLRVFLHHNGKVTAHLKCSDCPVEVSVSGLVDLASFLGGVRIRMVARAVHLDQLFEEQMMPEVSDWMVVQWHYGRDGACEISGPAFNVTFRTWFGELARIYMRRRGNVLKPRLEVVESPRKTLQQAFVEKIT